MTTTLDLLGATEHNRKYLGLDAIPEKSARRLSFVLAEWQANNALAADGCYDNATEALIDAKVKALNLSPSRPTVGGVKIELERDEWIPGLTVDDVEKRWAAMATLPIVYALGSGGKDPRAADPRTTCKHGFGLDCTGAGAHGFGLKRKLKNFSLYGGYMNSDSIVADARGRQEVYEKLDAPVRGCALVFPGIDFDEDGDRERIGHFAWVRRVLPGFDPAHPDYRLVEIYDCAGSNSSKVPGAKGDVALHVAGYFNGKATFKGVTDPKWATVAVWCKTVARP